MSNFIAHQLAGTYWGVGSAASHYDDAAEGYSEALAAEIIGKIRTDLDSFSEAEQAVLENHGYALAEAAIHRHAPELIEPGSPPFRPPNPDWLDEAKIRQALRDSHRRRLFS